MARWEETLDYQLDLWKFWRSPRGKEFAGNFSRSILETDAMPMERTLFFDLSTKLEQMAWLCEPIYVDPDMQTLLEAAIVGFKKEPLHPQDLITPAGFMVFPRPISKPDIHGKISSFRAMSWYPMNLEAENAILYGVYIALYHHLGDKDDYSDIERIGMFGNNRLILSHVMPMYFSKGRMKEDGSEIEVVSRHEVGSKTTLEMHDHRGEKSWVHPADPDDPRDVTIEIQAIWRLMLQTITVKTQEQVSKPFRKRAKKAEFPEKKVTVIKLRRPRAPLSPDHEPKNVEWTHRWLVSGHWRNQFFRSLGIHRQIYIHPYIKGDPDLPLVIRKQRVFEFVR